MSSETTKGYFQILTKALRIGDNLAFTCYVLLEQNEKLLPLLLKNTVFTEAKKDKLYSYGHDRVYIKDEEKYLYYAYLESRVQDGDAEEIRELIREKIKSGNLIGLPEKNEESAEKISKLLNNENGDASAISDIAKIEENNNQESTITSTVNENINLGSIELHDDSQNVFGNTLYDELFKEIKNTIVDIEDVVKIKPYIAEDEKIKIKDVTEKIEDLIKVVDTTDTPSESDVQRIAQNLCEKVNFEHVFSNSATLTAQKAKKTLEKVRRSIVDKFSQYIQGSVPNEPEKRKQLVKEMIEKTTKTVETVKLLISDTDKEVFENQVRSIIATIENKFNEKLNLFEENSIDQISVTTLNATPENLNKAVLTELENKLDEQKALIQKETEVLKNIKPEFNSLLKSWISFQAILGAKIDPENVIRCKDINRKLREIEQKIFSELNRERVAVKESNIKLISYINKEKSGNLESSEETFTFEMAEQISDDDINASVAEAENEENSIERLRAENSILSVQLNNAQTLVNTTIDKNSEMEKVLNDSGEYADKLESENVELRKKQDELLQQIESYEADIRRLHESVNDANSAIFRNNTEFEAANEKVARREDRINVLEKDIETLTKDFDKDANIDFSQTPMPEKVKASFVAKMNQLIDADKLIEKLKKDTDTLRSENTKLNSLIENLKAERKDITKRVEKAKIESETSHKNQKTLELKVTTTNNLLSQARKTINKLTTENEQLRQDRLKHINKTNEIVAEQRALISQAMNYGSQVQVELSKNRQLNDQMDAVKRREQDLQKSFKELQREKTQMQYEIKQLNKTIQDSSSGTHQLENEQLRQKISEIESKVEVLKEENKNYKTLLVKEQQKTNSLAKQLKANKSKKSAA